jgi:HK97 family phage major capsid protein
MTDNLNQKLTGLREKEVEKRSRVAELASTAGDRALNSDENSELDTLETAIGELSTEQRSIEKILKIGPHSESVNEPIGLDDKEKRNFSMLKLIRALDPKATQQDRADASLELEASSAIEQRDGVAPKGAFLPMEVMGEWRGQAFYEAQRRAMESRDLSADVFASAGAFVGVDFRPTQMIPLLRNAMALTRAGVTFLDGLVGDVAIPKHTGATTAGWVGSDGGTIGEGTQTAGQVTLTPKTLGTFTDYTRQLRLQSSVSVENFIRNDIATVIALEIDRAGIHGTGTSGQPVGIENTTGIGAQSFAGASDPTRDEVIGMRSDLATANALLGAQKFITNSTVYGNMLGKLVDSGSGQFLLKENGQLLGRECIESNQVQSGEMYFGNWADLLIGQWGALDVLVDPYTGATAGNVRILMFQSIDLAVRHAESFCKGSA